ncbi:hypothetical protein [uncultured Porphyromonas sp.]|uniref:hypothetical protein n=1 Tax=uncultured Porphyromonas sp. TaxID=159274 RepID=UPI00258DA261|nr:hypothetical protein [uncultured Porphyromonas sp.]
MDKNTFKKAIEGVKELCGAYRKGLQALNKDCKDKVEATYTRLLYGSVDIDKATKDKYPQDSRWDYVVCYHGALYFIELHPASTSNVKEVLDKLGWLKDWLEDKAELGQAKKSYHWIATGCVNILPNSPQYKQLASKGLLPKTKLKLGN